MKRIEQLAPSWKRSSSRQPRSRTWPTASEAQGPAEGPLWWKEGRYLLFSDIHNNKRLKYVPGQGVSLVQEPTNRANGLTRDLQGRLLACEHDSRRVTRQELDGSLTVLANSFQGRRLNRPNDVVVKSDGASISPTPGPTRCRRKEWDLTFAGVYRLTPDLGTFTLLIDDFVLPNGLAFSPDEQISINDTRRRHIRSTCCPTALSPSNRSGLRRPRATSLRPRRHEGGRGGQRLLQAPAASGSWTRAARSSAASSTARRPRPTSRSAAMTGRRLYFTSRNHLGRSG